MPKLQWWTYLYLFVAILHLNIFESYFTPFGSFRFYLKVSEYEGQSGHKSPEQTGWPVRICRRIWSPWGPPSAVSQTFWYIQSVSLKTGRRDSGKWTSRWFVKYKISRDIDIWYDGMELHFSCSTTSEFF